MHLVLHFIKILIYYKLIIYIIYSNETDADILYFGSLTNTPDTNSQNSGLHFLTFNLGGS